MEEWGIFGRPGKKNSTPHDLPPKKGGGGAKGGEGDGLPQTPGEKKHLGGGRVVGENRGKLGAEFGEEVTAKGRGED